MTHFPADTQSFLGENEKRKLKCFCQVGTFSADELHANNTPAHTLYTHKLCASRPQACMYVGRFMEHIEYCSHSRMYVPRSAALCINAWHCSLLECVCVCVCVCVSKTMSASYIAKLKHSWFLKIYCTPMFLNVVSFSVNTLLSKLPRPYTVKVQF